jgi:site-specific DNA-methyltransferase (adenine-specific)
MKSEAHNSDCLAAMREMPDDAFDLCLTDPPYNVGFIYSMYKDKRADYREWCNEWFSEAVRVSKCLVFTPGTVNFLDQVIEHRPRAVMSWFKPNQCSGSTLGGFNVWEPILVYGKQKYKIPQDGIYERVGFQLEADFHPCPKSLVTWQKLMGWFARPGDTVLDIFLGSGTGRIAANKLNLDFTGYEIDTSYFEAQETRFANHIAQPQLFVQQMAAETQEGLF